MGAILITPTQRLVLSGGGLAALLAVAHVANDAVTSMLSTLLPTVQERFDRSVTALALLVATLSFSSSITQPIFGARPPGSANGRWPPSVSS